MDDKDFKKAVRYTAEVKLGLQVIDGLLIRGRGSKKEMDDPTKQDNMDGGCSAPLSLLCYYHGRYLISKAAESMVNHITNDLIGKCPRDEVTLRKRPQDYKQIPSQFIEGLESRTDLLDQILKKLIDDQVDSVGLFGMGGIGKTTLSKEVNMRAKDSFAIKVMVEISDAPDFVRIQDTIAESIGLPLHDIHDVSQRAIRLYNRLSDVKKEENILIILDNVWKKLNLNEVGIPPNCKLLLTTRDREVCRVMDVQDVNIREVGVLSTNEARELFKSRAGNQVDAREYKNVVERLLSKCGGLPLAIVATANSLKDKNLYSWVKFADDLEKPISSQRSGGDYHDTFVILNTSYKFIQPDEKRIFFLLACLSPLGSSVSIESLMRFGMGLNLFEYVNKLSEAMEQAVTWANELMQASMLLEGDVKGDVKIHDIVRDFAISYATKEEEHKFMVEGIPRWMDDKTFKKYTAMSLTSKNDISRLSGVEAWKLQILILKGDLSPNVDDFFFEGMENLEVLAVSNMNFQPSLPKSMRELKQLRTLCMDGCKLGNIELIGELVNLLVLSLRESFVENLPDEIGNLYKLRLLDLSQCTCSRLPLIPTGFLSKFSSLEGLYIYNNMLSVFETKSDYEEANAIENNWLPYLNALEIRVAHTEELPIDGQCFKSLDKFRISVGVMDITVDSLQNFCCMLNLDAIDDVSGYFERSCLKVLLKKADCFELTFSNNFENLVPQLDQEGFRSLRSLCVSSCNDIKYIVDGCAMNNLMAFPCLQSLTLKEMKSLELVCMGNVAPETFLNLQTIKLHSLDELPYGLPLVPHNVKEISVNSCKLLKFMFIEDEELKAIELPSLNMLELDDVPCLLTLVGPKKFSNTHDALQGMQIFFDKKMLLPSLELFVLSGCNNFVKLWSKETYTPGFQNLKNIKLVKCKNLSCIGSSYVFSNLLQLETLIIKECNEMCEVISVEEIEEFIRFPNLIYLELVGLSSLESFYGGVSKLEFPKLKTLILEVLGSMKRLAKLENSSVLFHEKIDVRCLEELRVISMFDEVTGLWDKQSVTATSNPAPLLRQLALGKSAGLRQIPSVVLGNLSSLSLADFHDDNALFSSSDLGEKEGFVWIYSELPNLKELKVEGSQSLKDLFEQEDDNATDDALTSFCEQFKTLDLNLLPSLNLIPLHLFKNIASLALVGLRWDYLISAHLLDSLHQLEYLSIERCEYMEALVINVGSHIELPNLKQLGLCDLYSCVGISSMPEKEATLFLPSLESLLIEGCYMEHFWSGSIVAPRLQVVHLEGCGYLQQFLVGNREDQWCDNLREVKLNSCQTMTCFWSGNPNHDDDLQLPSLEIMEISVCENLQAFSHRRVVAPKLTHIKFYEEEHSMLAYDDLNHFLQTCNPMSDSKDQEDFDSKDQEEDFDEDDEDLNEN